MTSTSVSAKTGIFLSGSVIVLLNEGISEEVNILSEATDSIFLLQDMQDSEHFCYCCFCNKISSFHLLITNALCS